MEFVTNLCKYVDSKNSGDIDGSSWYLSRDLSIHDLGEKNKPGKKW